MLVDEVVEKIGESKGLCVVKHSRENIGEFDLITNAKKGMSYDSSPDFVCSVTAEVLDDRVRALLHASRMIPVVEKELKNIAYGEYSVMLSDERIVTATAVRIIEGQENESVRDYSFLHWDIKKTELDGMLDNIKVVAYAKRYPPIGNYNWWSSLLVRGIEND